MSSSATHATHLLQRQTFWCVIFVIIAFLGGIGLGARIAVHGIRWNLQQMNTPSETSAVVDSAETGEMVGQITILSDGILQLQLADTSVTPFRIHEQTTVFAYAGGTPILPGEQRTQLPLTLADLQPHDMVVVRYSSENGQAVVRSIQKII